MDDLPSHFLSCMIDNLEYLFEYAFINNFHSLAHILAIYLLCASYPVKSYRNRRSKKTIMDMALHSAGFMIHVMVHSKRGVADQEMIINSDMVQNVKNKPTG